MSSARAGWGQTGTLTPALQPLSHLLGRCETPSVPAASAFPSVPQEPGHGPWHGAVHSPPEGLHHPHRPKTVRSPSHCAPPTLPPAARRHPPPQREARPVRGLGPGAWGLSRAGGSTCRVPAGSEGARTTPRRSCSTASSPASCGRMCTRRRCVRSPVRTRPWPLPAALPQAHRVCTAGFPPELCARTSLRPRLGKSYVGVDSPDRAPCARRCLLKPGSAVGALVPLSHSLPLTSVPPAAGRAQACSRSARDYAGWGHSTCLSGAGGSPSQE